MNQLLTGQFFGQTNKIVTLDGITLTDTVYTHDEVDWHYHQNAYFTFILKGNIIEGNKKEIYNCSAGSLLFHNCEEPHYNIKPPGLTRGFHIEADTALLANLDTCLPHGSISIPNPEIKFLTYRIFRETALSDPHIEISVQSLLLEIAAKFKHDTSIKHRKPQWVDKIKNLLYDNITEKISLNYLAAELNLHPVHISRDFRKYFNCSLGEYIRKIRVEKAMSLLVSNKPITEIAYECGFYDQSHLIRCFREFNKVSPSLHKKLLNQ